MRTEELIRVLTADGSKPVTPVRYTLLRALAFGALLSSGLFLLILHPRPDIEQALHTIAFDFKLVVAICVTVASAALLMYAAVPAPTAERHWLLLVGPTLLAAGIVIELATAPMDTWTRRLLGHNAAHCLSLIPLLSLPSLACAFFGLRTAAPLRPSLAGAIAGLLAGGVGATLYALSCPDDSPLFVATWYSIAVGAVAAVSAIAGGRWLRW